MTEPKRFAVTFPILDEELDLFLAYPTLEAAWWERTREDFERGVEAAGVEIVSPWEWSITRPLAFAGTGSLIVGKAWAVEGEG
jgi:hypothetical protein